MIFNFYSLLPHSTGEDWVRAGQCFGSWQTMTQPLSEMFGAGFTLFFATACCFSAVWYNLWCIQAGDEKQQHVSFTGLFVRVFCGVFQCSGRSQLRDAGMTSCYSSWGWSFSPARSRGRQSFQASADAGAMPSLISPCWAPSERWCRVELKIITW